MSGESRRSDLDVSLVIPVWNEEGNVELLYERCALVLEELGHRWEMVYVDDGSTDSTYSVLSRIHAADHRVRVIRMRRNFGQTAALAAGFDRVRGKRVVTLDGDLQNDPADIPTILAKMDEGYQVVSGWRQERKAHFLTRRLPSMVVSRLLSWLSGVTLHDYGCTLKGYDRRVVRSLHPYSEMHRFLPALASLTGARTAEIPVRDHPRHSGESKYGLSRVGKVLADLLALQMILHFSTKPRYWFGYLALPFGLLGTAVGLWALFSYIHRPHGTPFVVLPGATFLLFYLWSYLLTIGWIGELISASGTFRHGHFLSQVRGAVR